MDLSLNNLQRLICHKTRTTNQLNDTNVQDSETFHLYKMVLYLLIYLIQTANSICIFYPALSF